MFSLKNLAFFGFLTSGALAADVYATFYNPSGQISPDFDVGNDGCFAIPDALQVSFSQASPIDPTFAGPYCLNAWAEGGCNGPANGQQQYENVQENDMFGINNGVNNAGSYKWTLGACDGS